MERMRKIRVGRVLSDRMDKTVTVEVQTRRQHLRYKRVVTHRATFKAHDEGNSCAVGDLVRIVETRPLSKVKRWRVTDIVSKAEAVEVKPEEIE